MTRRLWPGLLGEREESVSRSRTGERNRNLRLAFASHFADRGLLILTVGWLALRLRNWTGLSTRPADVYEPLLWLGKLLYPEMPSTTAWFVVFGIAAVTTLVCFLKPRWWAARVVLAVSLVLVIVPEFGFGHVQHVNHLFLLAHIYSMFRPLGRPTDPSEAAHRASGYRWFLLGLLFIYTMAGLWKVVDMTIRDVLKPGVTWLHPDALLATSISQMRNLDLPMTIPSYIEASAWLFPIGYVLLTFIFCASFLGAFRRPLLIILVPTIALFHALNAVTLYALFLSTIVVATVVLLPWDYFVPAIRAKLVPIRSSSLEGVGNDARYCRRYDNGDEDVFAGFFAYRELLRDRSVLLASPLYYPGVAWVCSKLLALRHSSPRHGTG